MTKVVQKIDNTKKICKNRTLENILGAISIFFTTFATIGCRAAVLQARI